MSQENAENTKTLYNNKIVNALIRIDFDPRFKYDIDDVAGKFSHLFNSMEQRIYLQKFSFSNQDGEEFKTKRENVKNTVLINEIKKCSLIFSPEPPSIVFDMNHYISSSIYEDLFQKLTDYFSSKYPEELTARIGMRFINLFPAKNVTAYSKFLASPYLSIVRSICKKDKLCRTLVQQETNDDSIKVRVTYGLVNKYYPEHLVSKDLTIDIDAFTERRVLFKDWSEIIKELNQAAYNSFIEMIKRDYIPLLRGDANV